MSDEPPYPPPPEPPEPPEEPPYRPNPPPPGPPPPEPPEAPDDDDGPSEVVGRFGGSLLGVIAGLAIGLVLPPLVFGLGAGLLDGIAPVAVQILLPFVLGAGLSIWLFRLIVDRLDRSVTNQAAMRKAFVVTGYTCLGIWGVGLLLVGGCIALLASLY